MFVKPCAVPLIFCFFLFFMIQTPLMWSCPYPGLCTVMSVNSLRPRHDGRHFADDTFNRIFVNENVRISIKISLKFVSKVPINNIPALVQIMAWRRPGDKPLSEAMMVSRPQWVNSLAPGRYAGSLYCVRTVGLPFTDPKDTRLS